MAWVAVDRALKDAEEFGLAAPIARWRRLRRQIQREVLTEGYDAVRGCFTQSPAPRARRFRPPPSARRLSPGKRSAHAGRWRRSSASLPPRSRLSPRPPTRARRRASRGGGRLLACTFWLAANYALSGCLDEGRALRAPRCPSGTIWACWQKSTTAAGRQLGNFLQAFSHVPPTWLRTLPRDEAAERGLDADPHRTARTSWLSPHCRPNRRVNRRGGTTRSASAAGAYPSDSDAGDECRARPGRAGEEEGCADRRWRSGYRWWCS